MGEAFALVTAVAWAAAVILFKKSGEEVPPFALNFFRVTLSSILFIITLALLREPLWSGAPPRDYLILVLSGTIAIAISDTLFHRCLNTVGAGITAIVDCLYSPSVVLFAYILLGERLGPWQFGGMAVILSSILLASRHEPPAGKTRRQLIIGIMWGILSMVTVGLGIVIAKPVLDRSPVLWATAVRQFGCFLVMLPVALGSPSRRRIWANFIPKRNWRFLVPATVVGSFLALIFWIAGMKYTQAATAGILNQTSSIHILILASVFLHEPLTRRKIAAACLALAGIAMVTVG
ncbi:MAG: DMT family transporter [Candidatus Krumholzibacteriota bacterium]|nr:DMT family transporter [Candidatus Krumholzibacteriota bacterium]